MVLMEILMEIVFEMSYGSETWWSKLPIWMRLNFELWWAIKVSIPTWICAKCQQLCWHYIRIWKTEDYPKEICGFVISVNSAIYFFDWYYWGHKNEYYYLTVVEFIGNFNRVALILNPTYYCFIKYACNENK